MEKIKKKKTKAIIKRKINLNVNNSNSILFPHLSNLNNLKSKKYFSTISSNSDIMKKALQNYRANSISSNYKNQNELLQMTNSTISTLSATKKYPKIIKETKTKTCFNKLAPKLLHISSKSNINNDDTDEFKVNKNKDIIIHKKIISEVNPILNIDDFLDEDDSIDYDLNIDNNLNKYNALTERNKNDLSKCININDINFNECLKLENLFNDLIKDLENNKLDNFNNKINIVTKFLIIFNDKFNQNLFVTFDINSLNNSLNQIILNNTNNESIFLLIKEYLIQQLVFFYIIILISLIKAKHDRNIYLSGIQNLCFYFHQNFHVLNFILTSKINKNNIDLLGQVSLSFYKKCMIMVNENKTWLNDNNFMKCLKINNKLSKQVIKNLFEQLRIHFNNNNYRSNNNSIKKDKNKIYKNNKSKSPLKNKNNINNTLFIQKDYIESVINLLLEYIKSYKNVKFTNIIKDLKLFPPINYLLEKANIKLEKKTNINNLIVSTIKKKNNKDIINKERNILTEINKEKEINPPFLPKKEPKYKYSLILDLDETIVHYIKYKNSEYVQVRPYLDDFIKELSDYYEIIIFTASYQNYADLAINGIDIDKRIKYRLYRQHTMKIGNTIIKDLSKLGRDLKKIIIIDNCSENYSLQPKNGINLIDFTGNNNDDILLYLKKDLIDLYKKNPDDVRPYLKQIQINMNKRANELINLNKNKNLINLNKIQHNKKVIKDKIFEVIHENDNEINYS
jgi:Dullard-like phosphatase family protein